MVNIPVFVLCLSSISFSHVAAQIKQTKTDKFSSLCLRLSLWPHQVCFHGAITIIVLALALASLVKTRLCSAFQVVLRLQYITRSKLICSVFFILSWENVVMIMCAFIFTNVNALMNITEERRKEAQKYCSKYLGLMDFLPVSGLGVFIYFMNLSRTPSYPFLFIFFYMMADIS